MAEESVHPDNCPMTTLTVSLQRLSDTVTVYRPVHSDCC